MALTPPTTIALQNLNLSQALTLALAEAFGPTRRLRVGDRLAVEGDFPEGLHVVADGVLKSSITLEDGTAQTLALFVAGDLIGVQALALGHIAATLTAVSSSRVATIPAAQVRRLLAEHPALGQALWGAMARQAAVLQQWMVGMGRRSALCQIAHLLCETALRLRRSSIATGSVYDFPLTQAELADAVGLSQVHVNRVLQTLRADGLIQLRRGQLRIDDWARLAEVADFDPAYLGHYASSGDRHAPLLLPSGDAGRARDR
jgi:CRP-like cAMP-binding protein